MNPEKAKMILMALDNLTESKVLLPAGTSDLVRELNKVLSNAPDGDLTELQLVNRNQNFGSLLRKFGELSKLRKSDWVVLIETYELDIALKPTDSARDIMGRLAGHFRDNPNAVPNTRSNKPGRAKNKKELSENLQETLQRILDS